jgi:polar amino acid transport system permease protein
MSNVLGLLAFGPDGWGDELLAGAWLTVRLALATFPIGLAIGLGVARLKLSPSRVRRTLGNLFTTVFRGLPELLTIFIVYYGGQILIARIVHIVSPDANVQVNGFVAGVTALSLVLGAFSSEVFYAAIKGVPGGQSEAARALGLSPARTFRLVVLPQLWRLALPGLANNWLVLLKDTSLVSVIALTDLMRQTQVVVGATKQPFTFFALACGIYLVMSLISSVIAFRLEARANRGWIGGRT